VRVAVQGAVAWITVSNPTKRNALSVTMMNMLGESLARLDRDPDVRVIVLRGDGTDAFAAGADISEFEALRASAETRLLAERTTASLSGALAASATPVIAMIHGYCLGAGLAIALGADIRVAADTGRFAIPAARLGIGYPLALVDALVHSVGPGMAAEILFTARMLSADEALNAGLVNHVLPPDELEEATRELAATIAANAPLSVRAAKAAIRAAADSSRREAADALIAACTTSADAREGQRAFLEKRRPGFVGA
jgi:enoyl-CoA hydratase/carnithine racemase